MSREDREFVSTGRELGVKVDLTYRTIQVGGKGGPMTGPTASVEAGGELRQRITATRLVALGPFALAFKETTGDRDVYLSIENQGWVLGVEVKPKDEAKARRWARAFNRYAREGAEEFEEFDDEEA